MERNIELNKNKVIQRTQVKEKEISEISKRPVDGTTKGQVQQEQKGFFAQHMKYIDKVERNNGLDEIKVIQNTQVKEKEIPEISKRPAEGSTKGQVQQEQKGFFDQHMKNIDKAERSTGSNKIKVIQSAQVKEEEIPEISKTPLEGVTKGQSQQVERNSGLNDSKMIQPQIKKKKVHSGLQKMVKVSSWRKRLTANHNKKTAVNTKVKYSHSIDENRKHNLGESVSKPLPVTKNKEGEAIMKANDSIVKTKIQKVQNGSQKQSI